MKYLLIAILFFSSCFAETQNRICSELLSQREEQISNQIDTKSTDSLIYHLCKIE